MAAERTTTAATCRPRVGLLGNPSDGYGGRVLAACFADFAAMVTCVREHEAVRSEPMRVRIDDTTFENIESLERAIGLLDGLASLLAATLVTVHREVPGHLDDTRVLELEATTDIPRQVGLSGSSAVIVAALRALRVEGNPVQLAKLALHAETGLLGIAAGPQDRLIQAIDGAALLDFGGESWRYEVVDARLLPNVLLVLQRRPGVSSGAPHSALRQRFDAGDPATLAAMRRFAELADEGVRSMQDGDTTATCRRFGALFAEAFELRRTCYDLEPSDVALADRALRHGIGATLAGSGGALVAAPLDGDLERLRRFEEGVAGNHYACLWPQFEGSTPIATRSSSP
ncbi:MAG: hypothetical protein KDC95_08535 [Planctomycetes bacterium]|nr:hypothetical protein [Planctomycetota bacterium]